MPVVVHQLQHWIVIEEIEGHFPFLGFCSPVRMAQLLLTESYFSAPEDLALIIYQWIEIRESATAVYLVYLVLKETRAWERKVPREVKSWWGEEEDPCLQ